MRITIETTASRRSESRRVVWEVKYDDVKAYEVVEVINGVLRVWGYYNEVIVVKEGEDE